MKLLIDADILCYRIGFSAQDCTEDKWVRYRTDKFIYENILDKVKHTEYQLYLTDGASNFRLELTKHLPTEKQYKANRVAPRPIWYQYIKDYLQEVWDAELCVGIEADDAMSIEQVQNTIHYVSEEHNETHYNTCICSLDKDLNMIPGPHFNFVTGELYHVTYEEGLSWFYQQILMGDVADNVIGLQGIGPKKSLKILKDISEEQQVWDVIVQEYVKNQRTMEDALTNARLLWMLREPLKRQNESENIYWTPDYVIPVGQIVHL